MDAILAFLSQNQLFAAIVDIISIIGFIVTIWVFHSHDLGSLGCAKLEKTLHLQGQNSPTCRVSK